MSILTSVLGLDGIGGAVTEFEKAAGTILAKIIPDADKRLEAQQQLTTLAQQTSAAQMQAMSAVMVADSSSDSKFTKNARPVVVYWSLAMVTLIAVCGLTGDADALVVALSHVPDGLWNLMTYGTGIFAAGRTVEKVATPIAGAIAGALIRKK